MTEFDDCMTNIMNNSTPQPNMLTISDACTKTTSSWKRNILIILTLTVLFFIFDFYRRCGYTFNFMNHMSSVRKLQTRSPPSIIRDDEDIDPLFQPFSTYAP